MAAFESDDQDTSRKPYHYALRRAKYKNSRRYTLDSRKGPEARKIVRTVKDDDAKKLFDAMAKDCFEYRRGWDEGVDIIRWNAALECRVVTYVNFDPDYICKYYDVY